MEDKKQETPAMVFLCFACDQQVNRIISGLWCEECHEKFCFCDGPSTFTGWLQKRVADRNFKMLLMAKGAKMLKEHKATVE